MKIWDRYTTPFYCPNNLIPIGNVHTQPDLNILPPLHLTFLLPLVPTHLRRRRHVRIRLNPSAPHIAHKQIPNVNTNLVHRIIRTTPAHRTSFPGLAHVFGPAGGAVLLDIAVEPASVVVYIRGHGGLAQK